MLSLVEQYRIFGREEDKRRLPALIPHAVCPSGRRQDLGAVPSGLLMLDIDNHEGKFNFDPRAHYPKNESVETFRTRAAVIGMRAGALAWLLEGRKESRAAVDFALWVAEYTLYYQMKFFGRLGSGCHFVKVQILATDCD